MNNIATSSFDEGLDFALNLISSAIAETGERDQTKAQMLLSRLSQYIKLRYVGELRIAFEYLEDIYEQLAVDVDFKRDQFLRQIEWLRSNLKPENT